VIASRRFAPMLQACARRARPTPAACATTTDPLASLSGSRLRLFTDLAFKWSYLVTARSRRS
jgi:hypothetical protein